MDLDPMVSSSQEEYSYSDYDNRPIRPMNQEALNETLARLPILIDDDEYNRTNTSTDSSSSVKARLINRRQPTLAYSTRRKIPLTAASINTTTNQSLLHVNTTIGTPKNNKRKLGGFTPTVTPSATKVIKQLDCRQEIIQLKEENKILEEAKSNLQVECALLKNSHETEIANLEQEHQKLIDTLIQEHRLECEQFKSDLADKEQLLLHTKVELENLRNDQKLLLVEKDKLDQTITEYQVVKEEMSTRLASNELTIQQLREEIENLKKIQQQHQQKKQLTSKSTASNVRLQLKSNTTDRTKLNDNIAPINSKTEPSKSKMNNKVSTSRNLRNDDNVKTPTSSVNASLNKSNSSLCSTIVTVKVATTKSKSKSNAVIEEKKKSLATVSAIDKRQSLISTRTRSKAISAK